MDSFYLILPALLLLVIIQQITQQKRMAAVRHILNQKKQSKENDAMKELAKRFIGEECIIYTITSNDGSVRGLIKEIDDSGMVIEKKSGELEIINLDFVTRIRQYPKKKNGKKNSCTSYFTLFAGELFTEPLLYFSVQHRTRKPPRDTFHTEGAARRFYYLYFPNLQQILLQSVRFIFSSRSISSAAFLYALQL